PTPRPRRARQPPSSSCSHRRVIRREGRRQGVPRVLFVSGGGSEMQVTRTRGRIWPLIAVATALVPVAGVFTLSRIFFIRDLTLAFRSRFLFLCEAAHSGVWPIWDPYVANGQSAAGDALYQLFHFPSLPIRLLLPAVPAYNLWIALPVPLAALGAFVYLRRHVSPPAATLGAIAFAVAGPTV